VRTFCYGFLGVLLPLHLHNLGMTTAQIGFSITLTLMGSAILTYGVRRPLERYGTRRSLLGLSVLCVISAVLFLVTRNPWIVVLAAMIGNLAVNVGETGPFLSIEQVILARAIPFERRTAALSYYHFVGYGAAALGAALSGVVAGAFILFVIFLVGSVTQLAAFSMLSDHKVERKPGSGKRIPDSPIIRKIAALFSLDAFGGGFVAQSLVVFYFSERFGLSRESLGGVFFASQVLPAISLLLAPWLAKRIGLLNTMVSTHLVSNGFLLAIAFAPSAFVAIACWLGRQLLSQMDVPTRQAYLMAIVDDSEREDAAITTTLARTVTQAVSPSIAGWVMGAMSMAAPFALGGIIKTIYDFTIWQMFRKVPLRESA
jgi:MFS family permease